MIKDPNFAHILGRIEEQCSQIMKNQQEHIARVNDMDDRLRTVEQKAALNGAVTGGIVAVVVSILVFPLRKIFGG